LTGANTYTGTTAINTGVVNIENNTCPRHRHLGTIVSSGAALEIQGGLTAVAENITLNGTGVQRHRRCATSPAPTPSLARSHSPLRARFKATPAHSPSTGNIGGTAQNLTLDGAGNITIGGVIGTTTGTVTKNGSGYADSLRSQHLHRPYHRRRRHP